MEAQAENIEQLKRAILEEAREEAVRIRDEARASADAVVQRAREHADTERNAILERARKEAARLRGQAVATAQLKARTLQLEHRERLLDRVFSAARDRLSEAPKRPDYDEIVGRLIGEAVSQLRVEKAEVRSDAATRKVLKDAALTRLAGELKVELQSGAALEEGTGVVVDAAAGHLHYDNTFETRLSRLHGSLRAAVYQVLMGEKL